MNTLAARAAAVIGCLASASLVQAANGTVVYTASGTFATYPASGEDLFGLAGEPFSIRIEANEDLQPVKRTKNAALYDNLVLEGQVYSFVLEEPFYLSTHRASLFLSLGAAGQPDLLTFTFPYNIIGIPITVTANVTLPPGTLVTTGIQPFTAGAPLSPANATATYADESQNTVLAVAIGTFDATVGPPPSAVTTLDQFTGGDGYNPIGLAAGPNGVFYGTTAGGGANNMGTVFELAHGADNSWTETVLYSFAGGSDGALPSGGVLVGSGGTLYGLTNSGGTPHGGTVFQLTPGSAGGAWTETIIYSFYPAGQAFAVNPVGSLAADANGALYGVTEFGGGANAGTVFQLAPTAGGGWTEATLYEFAGRDGDGGDPEAGLVLEPDGSLYGTTSAGGTAEMGTVFRLTPPGAQRSTWTETVLYSFAGAPDGETPQGPLVALDGVLYGTTAYGGNAPVREGYGTVFGLKPRAGGDWSETVIYNFQGAAAGDGYYPAGGLLSGGGALYGTTPIGGLGGWGTVFRLNPAAPGMDWTETVLASFSGFDGATPAGTLAGGPPGALYGVAEGGGSAPCKPEDEQTAYCGTVFEVKP